MRSLEIGIPIYDNVLDASDTLRRAIALPGVTSIHLSVNRPGGRDSHFLKLAELDARVRVTLQPVNLGLYGNLRFLVNNAGAEYFSWLAADDLISEDFVQAFLSSSEVSSLTVSNFVHRTCSRVPNIVWNIDSTAPGWWPDRDRGNRPTYFSTEPSWIFGIWETKYLQKIFPNKDFDFLDTVLLSTALLDCQITTLHVAEPSVIGLWEGRPPNHVNGKFHKFSGWAGHALRLVIANKPLSLSAWRGYLGAFIGRAKMSLGSRTEYYRNGAKRL